MKTIKLISQFTAAAFLVGLFQSSRRRKAATSSSLVMDANVQTSVQLNISTGTGGAAVGGSGGAFSVSLGNVNGLGSGSAAAGVTKTASGDGYDYSTPINLTPVYSGFTTETADVTVEDGGSADDDIALEGASAGSMTALPSSAASVITNAASGSSNGRVVGFHIARTEAAGAKTATFVYTVTVQP